MDVASKKVTYEEFRQMEFEEDDRFFYELINGELVKKSAPSPKHQRISRKLSNKIGEYIGKNDLGEVFYAPIDVFLDEHSVPQPDIVFIKKENQSIIKPEEGILGVPDLMIEIISPSSIKRDRFEKKDLYEKFGIPEYWIVDPEYSSVEVYQIDDERYKLSSFASESGMIQSKALSGWELNIKSIF